jgi:hypothetical protein
MAATLPSERTDAKRLPDERFWKRYSPHYELPISSATSVALHALLVVFLVAGAVLAARWGLTNETPPPVEGIVIGAGGNPNVGGPADAAVLPRGQETAANDREQPPITGSLAPPNSQPLKPQPPPLLPAERKDGGRPIEEQAVQAAEELHQAGARAGKQLEEALKKAGAGSRPGPGSGRIANEQRERRKLRWTMIFDTLNGQDYLRQLHDLGAILAVPGPNGQYQVIRDLLKKPVEMKPEDLASLDRIYWADDKPQSVQSLAQALGIRTPEHIAAFFPAKMEAELLKKELNYLRRGTEEDIESTTFKIVRRGDHYEPMVVDQKLKRR